MTTKFRTDLVNKLLGGGVSVIITTAFNLGAMFAYFSLVSGNFDKYFGFLFLKLISVPIGAWLGWYAQSFTNFAQGQNHQSGDSDDAEQKRSRNAGIFFGSAVLLLLLYPWKSLWTYITLASIGVICIAAAFIFWKFYAKWFPDTKPSLK